MLLWPLWPVLWPLWPFICAAALYLRRREKELDEYERLLFGEDDAAPAEQVPAEDTAAEDAAQE